MKTNLKLLQLLWLNDALVQIISFKNRYHFVHTSSIKDVSAHQNLNLSYLRQFSFFSTMWPTLCHLTDLTINIHKSAE